jgi:hypothetical protein
MIMFLIDKSTFAASKMDLSSTSLVGFALARKL